MSALARARQAWAAVLAGIVLRLGLALAVGLVPASWAGEVTRHFPRGELALSEHGGVLLLDVFAHGSLPYGSGRLALLLGLFSITAGLVPFGAVVLALRERARLPTLLARSLARVGTSLLLSGVALLALALVLLVEVMAFGPVVTAFGQRSLVAPIAVLVLALPAPAAVALYGDALRVRGLLEAEGFFARFGLTLRSLRGRLGSSLARYLLAAGVQTAAVLGAVALALAVVARPSGELLLGLVGALFLLVLAAFARAWLLGHLVALVDPAGGDLEALQGSRDVGYEAARRETRPDSSVGRAED